MKNYIISFILHTIATPLILLMVAYIVSLFFLLSEVHNEFKIAVYSLLFIMSFAVLSEYTLLKKYKEDIIDFKSKNVTMNVRYEKQFEKITQCLKNTFLFSVFVLCLLLSFGGIVSLLYNKEVIMTETTNKPNKNNLTDDARLETEHNTNIMIRNIP